MPPTWRRMKPIAVLTLLVALFVFTPIANAHPYPRPPAYPFKGDLDARESWLAKAVRHYKHDLRELAEMPYTITADLTKHAVGHVVDRTRSNLSTVEDNLRRTRKEIKELRAALETAQDSSYSYDSSSEMYVPVGAPTSIDWICIHNNEGGWDQPSYAVDANGVPLFWGGLQFMISTWLADGGGQYAANPIDATPAEQIAVAEAAWDASGHSLAWLNGQWPNSSRACGYYG